MTTKKLTERQLIKKVEELIMIYEVKRIGVGYYKAFDVLTTHAKKIIKLCKEEGK